MTTLSDAIRAQADKLGIKVIDVGNQIHIDPGDFVGIPTPESWDRAGRLMRDAALLTREEANVYERFSVEQVQAMAQGKRGDSVQCTVLDEIESVVFPLRLENEAISYPPGVTAEVVQSLLDGRCKIPDGAKIIVWDGKK